MQESRLFRIVYYLIEKGKSTAPELAQKFEVSARTIYRDIDVISSAGIPIYATQGKNGGIIIDENFTLDRSMLSKKEKEQILSGLQALFVANSNNTNELLTKLGALFHLKTTNWIEVDFRTGYKDNLHKTFLMILRLLFWISILFLLNIVAIESILFSVTYSL